LAEQPPADRLEVGYVGKAHGLRGEVTVRLTTDRVERVDPGHVLYADGREVVVASSRPHQKNWVVSFEGVTDRNGAEALRGATLSADPIEDPDAIWVHDLIGAPVQETDGTPRGIIEAVQENPASDLLVTDDGALVPLTFFVEQREDSTVVIDPPAGLFDLEGRDAEPDGDA
jgi:16S rRNA processing protein RimM